MYKLKRSLYGLKQAPRAWYAKIDARFKEEGFVATYLELNLYVKRSRTSIIVNVVC